MSFMLDIYNRDVSEEISPDKAKEKILTLAESNPDEILSECLDRLEEEEDEWDFDDSHKKNKKKKKKSKKIKQQEKKIKDLEVKLERYKERNDERILKLEANITVYNNLLSIMVNNNHRLAEKNIICLEPNEFRDDNG